MYQLQTVPEPPRGGVILPGTWYITVPEERTNQVINPSFELTLYNVQPVGGSGLIRSWTYSRSGVYSLRVNITGANQGVRYGNDVPLLVTEGTWSASCWLLGVRGVQYALIVTNLSDFPIAETVVTATGRWQFLSLTYREQANTSRRLMIRSLNPDPHAFYIDCLQFERCEVLDGPSTYIDGDQIGKSTHQEYLWLGEPHRSRSRRLENCRTGGVLVNLSALGLTVLAITGLEAPTYQHRLSDRTGLPGASVVSSSLRSRTFSLTARLHGGNFVEIEKTVSRLTRYLIPPDSGGSWTRLIFVPENDAGEPIGEWVEIDCLYSGGLEGNRTNPISETVTLQFIQPDPRLRTGCQGHRGSLIRSDVPESQSFLYRINLTPYTSSLQGFPPGSVGPNLTVRRLVWDPSTQTVVVLGDFSAVGTVTRRGITRFHPDTGTFSSIGPDTHFPTGTRLNDAKVRPTGEILVGGSFLDAGSSANRDYVAYYQPSSNTWIDATSGTPFNNEVLSVEWDSSSDIFYVGGLFTSPIPYLARFSIGGPAQPVTSATFNGPVTSIYLDRRQQRLYVSGNMTSPINRVGYLRLDATPPTWHTMGTGLAPNEYVLRFLELPTGEILAVGNFSSVGVPGTRGVALWNGHQWQSLDDSLEGVGPIRPFTGALGYDTVLLSDGTIVVSGTAREGYGRCGRFPSRIGWYRGTWLPIGPVEALTDPGTPGSRALLYRPEGYLLVGRDNIANIWGTSRLQIDYRGTSVTFPVIQVRAPTWPPSLPNAERPCLYSIRNLRTGDILAFDGLVIQNETITIDCRLGRVKITSSRRGDISDYLFSGSVIRLVPGRNILELSARDYVWDPGWWNVWWTIEHSHLGAAL